MATRQLCHEQVRIFLPPPVTPSDEEPIAAGGWQYLALKALIRLSESKILNELSKAAEMRAGALRRFLPDAELLPGTTKDLNLMKSNLPPPVTLSDEEPIAAGGW